MAEKSKKALARKPLRTEFDDADAFRAMRQALGMSQEKFADLLGMHRQQLSAYENGRHTAGVRHLRELAARAGCRLEIVIHPPAPGATD